MTDDKTTGTSGENVAEDERETPWTDADVTTEDDVDRNTHSAEGAKRLRRQAAELAGSSQAS